MPKMRKAYRLHNRPQQRLAGYATASSERENSRYLHGLCSKEKITAFQTRFFVALNYAVAFCVCLTRKNITLRSF